MDRARPSNQFRRGRGGQFRRGGFGNRGRSNRPSVPLNPFLLVDRRFARQPLPETLVDAGGSSSGSLDHAYHPPTRTNNYYSQKDFPQDRRYFCDRCFRGYDSDFYYRMHLDNHVKCIADGCTFEGLPRIVAKHLLTFHAYNVSGSGGSKSSIEKWVQARKRNFPSKETVDEKERRDEAKLERGEILENRNKFGKFSMAPIDKAERKVDESDEAGPVEKKRKTEPDGETRTTELLEKLLAEEIRHERNVLLQCIRYILNNGDAFGIDKKRNEESTGKDNETE